MPASAPAPSGTAGAAATPTAPSPGPRRKLTVKRLVLARGVKDHEPMEAGTTFKSDARKVYAFVEIENRGRVPGEIVVEFEPPGGGAPHGDVTLAVGPAAPWRTWAYTRTASTAGTWTAVVEGYEGRGPRPRALRGHSLGTHRLRSALRGGGMFERPSLALFAHLCARPEAEIDLAEACLLVAEAETPGLDVAHYIRTLDTLGSEARAIVGRGNGDESRITRAVRFVYEGAGFRGNDGDYYDPRNSFLSDQVIERRTGIPITLAVVLIEVSRRAGVEGRGVSFPNHFLVRFDTPRGTIVVDPFAGRPVSREELRALHARAGAAGGTGGDPPANLLEPATKVQIVARVLHNLRGIYENRRDEARLRGVMEHIDVLTRADGARRRLGAPVVRRPTGLN